MPLWIGIGFPQRDAPAERRARHACLPQKLRHLPDITERVRQIPHRADRAVLSGKRHPVQQISHVGLAGGQIFILQNIPRAERQPPLCGKAAQLFLALRAKRQIVLHGDHLSVEVVRIGGVLLQKSKHAIQLRQQPCAVLLKRQIPFPVPMRMRHDMNDSFHTRFPLKTRADARW